MVMPYHLHMPSYFLETFTEYPYILPDNRRCDRFYRTNTTDAVYRKKMSTSTMNNIKR